MQKGLIMIVYLFYETQLESFDVLEKYTELILLF